MGFEVIGEIRNIEIIAAGIGVRSRRELNRRFGHGRWRKMKGIGTIETDSGQMQLVELHWYEAHGIGRVLMKRKQTIRDL